MDANVIEEFESVIYEDSECDPCYFTLYSGGINLVADNGLLFETQADIACFANYARSRLRAAKKIK